MFYSLVKLAMAESRLLGLGKWFFDVGLAAERNVVPVVRRLDIDAFFEFAIFKVKSLKKIHLFYTLILNF